MTMSQENNTPLAPAPEGAIETIDGDIPNVVTPVDESMLKSVILRLWQRHPKAQAELCIEVIDGPYKGIVFGFSEFDVAATKTADGMRPVKFSTKLFKAPKDFKKDAAWDSWTGELFIAWLGHVTTVSYAGLMRARTEGVQ